MTTMTDAEYAAVQSRVVRAARDKAIAELEHADRTGIVPGRSGSDTSTDKQGGGRRA